MDGTAQDDPQKLIDKAAIRETIYSYGHAVDRGERSRFAQIFMPGAMLHLPTYDGPAAALFDRPRSATLVTTHHALSNIRIKLAGDTAKAVTYINALHRNRHGDRFVDELFGSRYLDVFARHEGHWRIAERTSVRDWHYVLPTSPADAGAAVAGNASRVMGAFGPEDPGFGFLD